MCSINIFLQNAYVNIGNARLVFHSQMDSYGFKSQIFQDLMAFYGRMFSFHILIYFLTVSKVDHWLNKESKSFEGNLTRFLIKLLYLLSKRKFEKVLLRSIDSILLCVPRENFFYTLLHLHFSIRDSVLAFRFFQ